MAARKTWLLALILVGMVGLTDCGRGGPQSVAGRLTHGEPPDSSSTSVAAPTPTSSPMIVTTTTTAPLKTAQTLPPASPNTATQPVSEPTTQPPPACEQGWVLSGTGSSPQGLYAVGDIYQYQYGYQVASQPVAGSGVCTYEAPPPGINNGAPPCPDKADLTAPGGSAPINGSGGPGQLWALYWNRAYASFYDAGAGCTYVGP